MGEYRISQRGLKRWVWRDVRLRSWVANQMRRWRHEFLILSDAKKLIATGMKVFAAKMLVGFEAESRVDGTEEMIKAVSSRSLSLFLQPLYRYHSFFCDIWAACQDVGPIYLHFRDRHVLCYARCLQQWSKCVSPEPFILSPDVDSKQTMWPTPGQPVFPPDPSRTDKQWSSVPSSKCSEPSP